MKTFATKIPLLLSLAFVLSLFSTCNSEDENDEVRRPIESVKLRQVRLEYNDYPEALQYNVDGNIENPNGAIAYVFYERTSDSPNYSHEYVQYETDFDQSGNISVEPVISVAEYANILQRENPVIIVYDGVSTGANNPPGCGTPEDNPQPNIIYKTYIDGETISNLASASDRMVALPMKFDDPTYSTEESHIYTIEIYECYGYCNTNEYDKIADQKGQIDVTVHYVP